MSDTHTPPASGRFPADLPPRRPWTILGRLSEAVREQKWVADVLALIDHELP